MCCDGVCQCLLGIAVVHISNAARGVCIGSASCIAGLPRMRGPKQQLRHQIYARLVISFLKSAAGMSEAQIAGYFSLASLRKIIALLA